MLLDQNILACKDSISLLHQLQESKAEIEFNGGIDARFINDSIIDDLRKIKTKYYHFAWDDPNENLEPKFKIIKESGLKNPNSIVVYVLVNYWSSIEQDLHRIYTLRSMGFIPFVMIFNKQLYVDSRGRWLPNAYTKFSKEELIHFKINQHMQRWCNNIRLIKTSPNFENYEPYKKWKSKGMDTPKFMEVKTNAKIL